MTDHVNKQKQKLYISSGFTLGDQYSTVSSYMTLNIEGFRAPRKFYCLDSERPFLISEKYFQNRGSVCLQIGHWYPLSAFRTSESPCLIPSKNSQLILSYQLAWELIEQLPKILPPKNTLDKEQPLYSDWKFPENSIINVLSTGETIDTRTEDGQVSKKL